MHQDPSLSGTPPADLYPFPGMGIAMSRKSNLDTTTKLRVTAWVHAALQASGKTAPQLAEQNFGDAADAPRIEFPNYLSLRNTPSKAILERVEAKYQGNDLTTIYEDGPDGEPLWKMLGDDLSDLELMDYIDFWLLPLKFQGQSPVEDSLMLSMPFCKKVEAAFGRLVGKEPVDFGKYEEGLEPNYVSYPFEETVRMAKDLLDLKKAGSPPTAKQIEHVEKTLKDNMFGASDLCAVIALRKIAESRRECRSETRYLFDGMARMAGDMFPGLGIGKRLSSLLSRWKAPCSPRTIAIHDTIVRKNHLELIRRRALTIQGSAYAAKYLDKLIDSGVVQIVSTRAVS